jgi:hypothetical protein
MAKEQECAIVNVMSTATTQCNTNTPAHLPAAHRRSLPKHWKKVVGMLKGRRKKLEAHTARMRNEWCADNA